MNTSEHKIIIRKIIQETANAKTFQFEFLDTNKPAIQSGQFITLVFQTKHGEKRRSYSISSSPETGEPHCITVKKVQNGEFSRQLLSNYQVGDIIEYASISGLFILSQQPEKIKQYFFLAAGSGISPCRSLIKTLLKNTASHIVLIYSNASIEDAIFYNEINHLEEENKNRFRVQFLFSNKNDVYQSRLSKWLLEQLLIKFLIIPATEVRFYMCGPFEYMRMIYITLIQQTFEKNIFKENFNSLPRLIHPTPPDVKARQVEINIHGEPFQFTVKYPDTILAAAKKLKIKIPYSCEAGRCGSCAALCVKGKVWMAYNEVLMDDEIEKGMILTCQGFPIKGNVKLII